MRINIHLIHLRDCNKVLPEESNSKETKHVICDVFYDVIEKHCCHHHIAAYIQLDDTISIRSGKADILSARDVLFAVVLVTNDVSTQEQSSGLVAHENSTFRKLALVVSGPFMA